MFASSRKAKLLWRVGCLLDKLLHSTTRQCVTTGSDLGGSSAPSASIQSFASVVRRALTKVKTETYFSKSRRFTLKCIVLSSHLFVLHTFLGWGWGTPITAPPAKRPCGQARTGRRRSNVHKPLLERPHTAHIRHRRAMGQPIHLRGCCVGRFRCHYVFMHFVLSFLLSRIVRVTRTRDA